jgi:hypothetical protein
VRCQDIARSRERLKVCIRHSLDLSDKIKMKPDVPVTMTSRPLPNFFSDRAHRSSPEPTCWSTVASSPR